MKTNAFAVRDNSVHGEDDFFLGKTISVEGRQVVLDAVFDGVSTGGGKEASGIARETVAREFENKKIFGEKSAARALVKADEKIKEFNRRRYRESLSTCVLSVCDLVKGVGWVFNVGDSRAFLVLGGKAKLITRDQEDFFGILTSVLGWNAKIDVFSFALRKNDFLVLATDGLTDVILLKDFEKNFSAQPKEFAENLLQTALERKHVKRDDVTVLVRKFF